MLNLAIFGW